MSVESPIRESVESTLEHLVEGIPGGINTITTLVLTNSDDGHDTNGTWRNGGWFGGIVLGYNSGVFGGNPVRAAFSYDLADNIPQGAHIESATITFNIVSSNGTAINFALGCHDVDVAAQPSASNLPTSWTMTTGSTAITVTGTGTEIVTITSAIQEIVDRPSWDKNLINVFSIDSAGTGANNWAVTSRNTSPTLAAYLTIRWSSEI